MREERKGAWLCWSSGLELVKLASLLYLCVCVCVCTPAVV